MKKKLTKLLAELLAMVAMAMVVAVILAFRAITFCVVPLRRAFRLASCDFQEWKRQSAIDNGKVKP